MHVCVLVLCLYRYGYEVPEEGDEVRTPSDVEEVGEGEGEGEEGSDGAGPSTKAEGGDEEEQPDKVSFVWMWSQDFTWS